MKHLFCKSQGSLKSLLPSLKSSPKSQTSHSTSNLLNLHKSWRLLKLLLLKIESRQEDNVTHLFTVCSLTWLDVFRCFKQSGFRGKSFDFLGVICSLCAAPVASESVCGWAVMNQWSRIGPVQKARNLHNAQHIKCSFLLAEQMLWNLWQIIGLKLTKTRGFDPGLRCI